MTIRHVVAWKLNAIDPTQRAEHADQISTALKSLLPVIPEIESMTVGRNTLFPKDNFDVVLIADYADADALNTYVEHPEHRRVAGFIRPLVRERACVDFAV
ncbi:Dabb family protein [Microbacteriaceae bacterium VKM Ac-2855]|nr:Dabb family protein [Microbacteriaceae bacterium VKM Ac-2855]